MGEFTHTHTHTHIHTLTEIHKTNFLFDKTNRIYQDG